MAIKRHVAKAMTIAGSDSGGGAGIQADMKTFSALGVYGTTVITALTAQNTRAVKAVYDVDAAFVGAQIDAIMEDIGADATKTGMLHRADIIRIVAQKVREWNIEKLIIDPVMISKSGVPLLCNDAIQELKSELFPLAYMITPNIFETTALTGIKILSTYDMQKAAEILINEGPRYVIIKGGHLSGEICIDLMYDGKEWKFLESPRIMSHHTHGTGCTFSAAITAFLAKGYNPYEAVCQAKDYITQAIRYAYAIGQGQGPVHHFYSFTSVWNTLTSSLPKVRGGY